MHLEVKNPTYVFRAGDTLYSVARKYNMTPAELIALNPKTNPRTIRPGTVLNLAMATTPPKVPRAPVVQVMPGQSFDFHDEMRMRLQQHVGWVRNLIISILASLSDEADVTARLLQSPAQIAPLFRSAFGAQAEQAIKQLLTDHLTIGMALFKAYTASDESEIARQNQKWHQNADAIAAALHGLGPQFSEAALRQMLYRHLELGKQVVAARLSGDYPADIAAFDAMEREALMLADALADGISRA